MKLNTLTFFALLIITALSGATCKSQSTNGYSELEKLQNLMTGYFSSESQSVQDTSYLHIRLCMQPIWQERNDGMWLYVEQALWSNQQKPYRQRVYQLYQTDNPQIFVSKVYEIKEPFQWVGACSDEELRSTLTPEMLLDRPGCELYLSRNNDGSFSGSTRDGACKSSFRGAQWVSSHVHIDENGLISWDQGWSDVSGLVWGPAEGGYRFERLSQ